MFMVLHEAGVFAVGFFFFWKYTNYKILDDLDFFFFFSGIIVQLQ